MRLRTRLFAWYVTLTALGALLMAGFVFVSFRQYVLSSTETDLSARTAALAESVSDWLEQDNAARVRTLVSRYGAQRDLWLRVYGPDGSVLATSSPGEDPREDRGLPGVAAALRGQSDHGIAPGAGPRDDRMYQTVPLVRGGRRLGALRVSRTLREFNRLLERTAWLLAAAFLAVLALCAAVSARVARTMAGPIQRMRDFAVAVGGGRFSERLPREQRGEIGELSDALNEMTSRLATLDDERRTFLANASHELRTPVTNVHATLEALEGGAADDPAMRAQFIRMSLDETERMTQLVETLLDMGRLEAGVVEVERRPVDLGRLAERAVLPLGPRFDAAGVAVRLSSAAAWGEGDPERLTRALLNVLDNALKHSPPGSAVEVSVRVEGAVAAIEVRDRGPGFGKGDLPRVFEQFYAAERPGSRRGSGLGLAIAKRIVEAHGGTISAENHPDGGAVVTLRLPLRASHATPTAVAAPVAQAS